MNWLARFHWFRRWKRGLWHFDGRRWQLIEVTSEPEDVSDDLNLRSEIVAFLDMLRSEGKHDR